MRKIIKATSSIPIRSQPSFKTLIWSRVSLIMSLICRPISWRGDTSGGIRFGSHLAISKIAKSKDAAGRGIRFVTVKFTSVAFPCFEDVASECACTTATSFLKDSLRIDRSNVGTANRLGMWILLRGSLVRLTQRLTTNKQSASKLTPELLEYYIFTTISSAP